MGRGSGKEPSDARRAVVLLEELAPKVQLLMEGHTGIAGRLDRVVEELGRVGERIGRFETNVGERYRELHKDMMDGFEKVYGDMDGQFAGVNSRLDTLTNRFDVHERTHTG
jgi:hypothetical protein